MAERLVDWIHRGRNLSGGRAVTLRNLSRDGQGGESVAERRRDASALGNRHREVLVRAATSCVEGVSEEITEAFEQNDDRGRVARECRRSARHSAHDGTRCRHAGYSHAGCNGDAAGPAAAICATAPAKPSRSPLTTYSTDASLLGSLVRFAENSSRIAYAYRASS